MREFGKWFGDIEKKFGKGFLRVFSDADKNIKAIPTGLYSLDKALGIGGVPQGRIVEIYGQEATGKSTICLHLVTECQKQGGLAAYLDMEHALNPNYAEALGVNLDDMLVAQPQSAEECLETAENLARTGEFSLIVIDSVAALVPQAEINGEMGDAVMGLQARLMGQAMRKLTPIAHESNTCIVFVNQLREKIGVMFGSPETTPGGKALKFYASIRMDVRRVGPLKTNDKIVGNRVRVKVVKNKLASPFQEAELDLVFGEGMSKESDVLESAVKAGVIKQSGSWFSMEDEKLGQGKENIRKRLEEDKEFYQKMLMKLITEDIRTDDSVIIGKAVGNSQD